VPDAQTWSARYELGSIPWDLGRAHPELEARLAVDATLGLGTVGSVLVPGAGTGHDARALAAAGWDTTALDFAPGAERALQNRLSGFDAHVVIGDALGWRTDRSFDLVFDHTFFCALDPDVRTGFGAMVDQVLSETGSVVSVVFPLGKPSSHGGPPWGFAPADVDEVLGSGFELVESSLAETTPGRRWPHVWARWNRVRSDPGLRPSGE